MSLGDQSRAVLIATLALYPLAGFLFLCRGMLVGAGLAMAIVAQIPLVWQATFTDADDAPGFVFLLIPMLVPPVALILSGALLGLAGLIEGAANRRRKNARPPANGRGSSGAAAGSLDGGDGRA